MSSTKARHRKDARPVTSVTPVARRSLAAAASSGLALTMIASGAPAAGSTEAEASAGSLKEAGVGTLAANARAAVSTNAAVHVSPDASTEAADVAADVTAEAPVVEQPAPQANTSTDESASNSTTATNASATENAADSGRSTSNPAPAPASNAGGAVAIAMQYVGRPYVSGAAGPDAFDCSGLVQYVYAQMGISLPRTAQAQGSAGRLVSAAEAQPGDIVYFGHHVGIYAGDGKMIDAGTESTGVVYRDIYETPIGYVRVG
ncbi:NlpC/P60 family protein [Actinomyces gerencseriae]|uniref:C40 family peptidase n=1 Tax=Actinomyces gerencseriae TaxID=52769 RepID=UPI0028E7A2A6|nr:NlpC/P60 family protein [Actinomyces gerencseriae]